MREPLSHIVMSVRRTHVPVQPCKGTGGVLGLIKVQQSPARVQEPTSTRRATNNTGKQLVEKCISISSEVK